MRVFTPRRRDAQSRWLRGGTVLTASIALVVVAFMNISGANIGLSSFEGGDGNIAVDTAGNHDWAAAPKFVPGIDRDSGSSDNSLGGGTKEDNPSVKVGQGSIPGNKSDLTRFYMASDVASNNDTFLYLAWERANVLGSANMDFEINQKATTGLTKDMVGPVTLNRTAGDLLVTFDFGGSGAPALGLLRWVDSGSTSQCFSSSSLPCWGNRVDLTGIAEGAVNTGTFDDTLIAGQTRTLKPGTFGEASINLTAAGVFQQDVCTTFASALLKSRSSASFTSEVKDFVLAPDSVNVSNCGTITIRKFVQNGSGSFGFTTTGGLTPSTFQLSNGDSQPYTVKAGSYSVTESDPGSGWTLANLGCSASGTGTSFTVTGATVDIVLGADGVVDCAYTNHHTSTTSISTAQTIVPNDSATISGASGAAGGSVTFKLFAPTDATCSGTPAYSQTVNVSGSGTYSTTNTTFTASTQGTWRWMVAYTGDGDNTPSTSGCGVETFTIDNDTTN